MPAIAAILTGDLIASTAAGRGGIERAMGVIADAARDIGSLTGQDARFSRFRGDGWQLYLAEPGQCLWAVLLILARLAATGGVPQTRISVGLGPILPFIGDGLAGALGDAFDASGRGLDRMERHRILAISGEGHVGPFMELTFRFAEDLVLRWSPGQAQVIALALHPDMPTQEAIAAQVGVSRQAVAARLAAARYDLLHEAHLVFLAHFRGQGWTA